VRKSSERRLESCKAQRTQRQPEEHRGLNNKRSGGSNIPCSAADDSATQRFEQLCVRCTTSGIPFRCDSRVPAMPLT